MEFLIKYLISKSFFSIYVKGTILINFIVNGLFILYFLILIKNQKIVKIKSIILITTILFILTIIPIIYLYNSKDFFNQIFATIEIILFIATISIILYYFPKSIPDIILEKPNIKNIRGGILDLGTIFHNKKVFHSFKLKIADLQRHMLVYGQTGTGKTNFIQKLLIELNKKYPSIPFIIFEFKGEYNKLQNKIPNLKIIKPGINFSFNLFESDIFDPQIYVEILFDGLKSCQIIENNADFSPQMEKVLIDVLRKVCTSKKQRSWNFFFDTLQNYIKKFEKSIPLIKQTGISIKNRLRRYYEGSLNRLFNSSKNASKISELLSHNCIINLGEILKIGGNKEDVIFFANLVLKWIWESNIKKNPTDQLRHLTIFEDSSYIASQKILENSKLSSYLEDIALLLRGKGEALITLSTTLNISKNIILNSGSKIFFKFNEKPEDVLHYLGLPSNSLLKVKELSVGYCLAKIDSIPDVFLLNIPKIEYKRKIKEKLTQESKNQALSKYQSVQNLNTSNFYKNSKKMIDKSKKILIKREKKENKFQISNKLRSSFNKRRDDRNAAEMLNLMMIEIKKSEKNYLLENFPACIDSFHIIDEILKENIHIIRKYNTIQKKIEIFKDNLFFIENSPKDVMTIPEKIRHSILLIKDIIFYNKFEEMLVKPEKHLINLNAKNNELNLQNKVDNNNQEYGLLFFYFDEILGPELYYSQNKSFISKETQLKIASYMDFQTGEFKINFSGFQFYVEIFEIDSKWARGSRELVEYVIFFKENLKDKLSQQYDLIAKHFIKELQQTSDLFQAFYLTNKKYLKTYKDQIMAKSYYLKKKIQKHFQEKILNIDKKNNSLEKLNILINKLKLQENKIIEIIPNY